MRKVLVAVALVYYMMAGVDTQAIGKEAEPIGAFPSEWLDFTPDLYPIDQQPKPIQWQAGLAVQAAMKNKHEMVVIEAHDASRDGAEKLLRYLVDHHKFPENRFVIAVKNNPIWKGWTTVRPESAPLPESAPGWEMPMIRTSLASPMTPEEAEAIYRYTESGKETPRDARYRVRPGIGIQWFNMQTDKRASDTWSASWLGVRAAGERTLYEQGALQIGASTNYYTSLTGLNEESLKGRISSVNIGGYGTYHFEPSSLGMLEARLDTGFHGTWRKREDASAFTPPVRAPFVRTTLSTSFDEAIRLGTSLGYVFAGEGILQAGGSLRHRIFSDGGYQWDAAFGLDLSLARFRRGNSIAQESWSTVQVGFVGSL